MMPTRAAAALWMLMTAWPGTQGSLTAIDAQVAQWRVSTAPTFSVAGAPGRGGEFEDVKDVLRLSNGNVVVADDAHRLLLFSPEGSYLRTIGSEGQGPGEFQRGPLWLQRVGADTILAFELGNGRRLTYFTAEGECARSVSQTRIPLAWYVGALADGSLVGTVMDACGLNPQPLGCPTTFGPPRRPNEIRVLRSWMQVIRKDAQGQPVGSLGIFPQIEEISTPAVALMAAAPPDPLLRDTHVATGRDRVYVSTGERFRVLVLSVEGDTIGVIERSHELRRVTEEDFFAWLVERFPQRVESLRAADWSIPDDQTAPAVLDLVVAESGMLWIEEGREDVLAPGTWHVYDGLRHVATVEMPPSFRPRHIGGESIVGIWTDELDVDWVQERAIEGRR